MCADDGGLERALEAAISDDAEKARRLRSHDAELAATARALEVALCDQDAVTGAAIAAFLDRANGLETVRVPSSKRSVSASRGWPRRSASAVQVDHVPGYQIFDRREPGSRDTLGREHHIWLLVSGRVLYDTPGTRNSGVADHQLAKVIRDLQHITIYDAFGRYARPVGAPIGALPLHLDTNGFPGGGRVSGSPLEAYIHSWIEQLPRTATWFVNLLASYLATNLPPAGGLPRRV